MTPAAELNVTSTQSLIGLVVLSLLTPVMRGVGTAVGVGVAVHGAEAAIHEDRAHDGDDGRGRHPRGVSPDQLDHGDDGADDEGDRGEPDPEEGPEGLHVGEVLDLPPDRPPPDR